MIILPCGGVVPPSLAASVVVRGTSSNLLGFISNLSGTPGDTEVVLSWTAPSNAISQQPWYKEATSGTWLDFGSPLSGTATAVTVTDLTNDTAYDFRISATDGATTHYSNEIEKTPEAQGTIAFEMNPTNYSSLTELWAADYISERGGDNIKTFETGVTTPYGTNQNVVKVQVGPDTGMGSGFAVVHFPNASVVQPREIWMEWYIKFDEDWMPSLPDADHKTWLTYPVSEASNLRWTLKSGNGQSNAFHIYPTYTGTYPGDCTAKAYQSQYPLNTTYIWNGQWSRLRQHLKYYDTGVCNGKIEAWFQNPAFKSGADHKLCGDNSDWDEYWERYWTGIVNNNADTDGLYFEHTILSDIVNTIPDPAQFFWGGRFRLWYSDPGW